jgi:CubicO group peptidase (beta-lactamase class C family)
MVSVIECQVEEEPPKSEYGLMKGILLKSVLLLSVMISACDSNQDNIGGPQLERIDGSHVSASDLEQYVAALMDSAGVMGLQMAIINDGRVVYSHEFGLKSRMSGLPPDEKTVFVGCSFSKPVFAYLVMQLIEDGLLDPNHPLIDYLRKPIGEYPEWKDLAGDDRLREITARRVLTHTTGWPNLRMQMEDGKLRFIYPPGEWFSYSGEGFHFLQFVIEEITGQPLDLLARERIFTPLNMSRTGYVWEESFEGNHADGHTERQRRIKMGRRSEPSAAGSLVSTASDYARFVVAVLNGEGLQHSSVDQMLSAHVSVQSKRMFGPLSYESTEDNLAINLSWGLGWGRFDSESGRAFFHTGHDIGWENYTVTYLDRKIGIVLLSNSSNFESIAERVVQRAIGDRHSPFVWLMYQPFDPSIPPPPPEPERETVKVDPAIFDAVAGEYEVQPGDFILLKVENGRLFGSGDGQYWDDVMAVSEELFFIDGKPYDFKFNRDSEGAVTGLTINYQGLEIPAKRIR